MIVNCPEIGKEYWFINHKTLYPRLNDVFKGVLLSLNQNGTVGCRRLADEVEFPNLSRLCMFNCNPMHPDKQEEPAPMVVEIPGVYSETEKLRSISFQEFTPHSMEDIQQGDRVYLRWDGYPGVPKYLHNSWVTVIETKRTRLIINPYKTNKDKELYVWANFNQIRKVQRPL